MQYNYGSPIPTSPQASRASSGNRPAPTIQGQQSSTDIRLDNRVPEAIKQAVNIFLPFVSQDNILGVSYSLAYYTAKIFITRNSAERKTRLIQTYQHLKKLNAQDNGENTDITNLRKEAKKKLFQELFNYFHTPAFEANNIFRMLTITYHQFIHAKTTGEGNQKYKQAIDFLTQARNQNQQYHEDSFEKLLVDLISDDLITPINQLDPNLTATENAKNHFRGRADELGKNCYNLAEAYEVFANVPSVSYTNTDDLASRTRYDHVLRHQEQRGVSTREQRFEEIKRIYSDIQQQGGSVPAEDKPFIDNLLTYIWKQHQSQLTHPNQPSQSVF